MVAYFFSKKALLAIDTREVPGINVSDIIPSGDCNSTEKEFLFLPTETISVEPISIQNFFDIAIEQGEEIIVSWDMLKEGASCYCGKVFVRELDYSNEKVEITLDELCNLFDQYRQDIMIIRSTNRDSKEYTEAYIRVMQFKKNCTTFIYQKFHEMNLIIDNQDSIKNSSIQLHSQYYMQEVFIGNTGEMYKITDKENGQEYYFKPAVSKAGNPRPYRAHIQEAAYQIQQIINPELAVKCNIKK